MSAQLPNYRFLRDIDNDTGSKRLNIRKTNDVSRVLINVLFAQKPEARTKSII